MNPDGTYRDGVFGFPAVVHVAATPSPPDIIGRPLRPLPQHNRDAWARALLLLTGLRMSSGGPMPEDILAAYAVLRRKGLSL